MDITLFKHISSHNIVTHIQYLIHLLELNLFNRGGKNEINILDITLFKYISSHHIVTHNQYLIHLLEHNLFNRGGKPEINMTHF